MSRDKRAPVDLRKIENKLADACDDALARFGERYAAGVRRSYATSYLRAKLAAIKARNAKVH